MKKILVLLIMISCVGCTEWTPEQQAKVERFVENIDLVAQQREADLVARFKEAFPDNWEEKLLEYKLHQKALMKQQQTLSQQRELMRQYQSQLAWQQFWQTFNENYQRQLDRNAYGYQPIIITPQRNPNYWQEQYYQQKVTEYKNPLDSLSKKYGYDPWK